MYKKIALLFALIYPLMQHAANATWLELKPSYFFLSSKPMKQIYSKGGVEIQGSISTPLCNYVDLYGCIGYRKLNGNALTTCEPTSLKVIPVDVGLKARISSCKRIYGFCAIGPRFFCFEQCNSSPYLDRVIDNGKVGFFLNAGVNLLFAQCFLVGIFGEYSYEKKAICPSKPNVFSGGSVQLGGFAFGASLGCAF